MQKTKQNFGNKLKFGHFFCGKLSVIISRETSTIDQPVIRNVVCENRTNVHVNHPHFSICQIDEEENMTQFHRSDFLE